MRKKSLPEAYAFRSALSLEEMLELLNQHASYHWSLRDSDYDGLYLLCRPDEGYTKLRIYGEGPLYLLDIEYVAPSIPPDELLNSILTEILPLAGAQEVRETQGH